MKKIEAINYVKVLLLIIFTVLLTFALSKNYLYRFRKYSDAYYLFSKISINEINEYIMENPDLILYIDDKYNTTSNIGNKFVKKMKDSNFCNKVLYFENKEIKQDFLIDFKNRYNVELNINDTPIVVSFVDGKVKNISYLNTLKNIDGVIEYGDYQ